MDTIFALASAPGRAALAVVRVSGSRVPDVIHRMVGVDLHPRRMMLAALHDPTSGEVLDEALAVHFPAPASFTGEDVLELHLHGGRAVVQGVLTALGGMGGCRQAHPGEFTRRAVLNGKLDLNDASDLADLIAADTALQRRRALSVKDSTPEFMLWRSELIRIRSMLEAWLEFPDEDDISDDLVQEASAVLKALIAGVNAAIERGQRAEVVRSGYRVLLAGPPNAGKSSLMNHIAARDVALVSDTPGTTRDLIEVTVDLYGVPVIFTDSAGVRMAQDPVERMGIDRTFAAAGAAQLVLWLDPVDRVGADPIAAPDFGAPEVWRLASKCDLRVGFHDPRSAVSAHTGAGVDMLLQRIFEHASAWLDSVGDGATLRSHQSLSAMRLLDHLTAASKELAAGAAELALEELRAATSAMDRLSSGSVDDEVMDLVFARFCIGK